MTGSIVKSDGKILTIKSEFAGTVSVPLAAVVQITSDQSIYLTLKDNQTLVGTVGTIEGKLAVRTIDAGSITLS